MKLPIFFWQFVIGIIFGLLGWLSWGFSFHWAVIFGVIIGILVNFIIVAFRGQK